MFAKAFIAAETDALNRLSDFNNVIEPYDLEAAEQDSLDSLADQLTAELLAENQVHLDLYGAALDITTSRYGLGLDDYIGLMTNPEHPTNPRTYAKFIRCRQEVKAIITIGKQLRKNDVVTVIDVGPELDELFGPPITLTTGIADEAGLIVRYSEEPSPNSIFPGRNPSEIVTIADSQYQLTTSVNHDPTSKEVIQKPNDRISILGILSSARLSFSNFYDKNPLHIDTSQANRIVALGDEAVGKALDGIRRQSNIRPEAISEAKRIVTSTQRSAKQLKD